MGTSASTTFKRDVRDRPENASDELRLCEKCEKCFDVSFCNLCKKIICHNCCQHSVKENKFYSSSLLPVLVDSIHEDGSRAITKIRVNTIGTSQKYVMIINGNNNWQLCYIKEGYLNELYTSNKFDDSPGDLCFAENQSTLFITVPNIRMVCSSFYWKGEYDRFEEAFVTPLGACFGITPLNNGLAVSVQTSGVFLNPIWQIQFVDFQGNVQRRIQNNTKGEAYFGEPISLTSNKNGQILFVCDKKKNTVFSFDVKGNLMYLFNSKTLQSPLDIAADKFENIYVACGKKVVQIKKGGERCRELALDMKNKIMSLCIDHRSDRLALISETGHIAIFDFD